MTNMPSIPFRTGAAIIPSLVPGPRWMVYYLASAFVQAWIWSTHVILGRKDVYQISMFFPLRYKV